MIIIECIECGEPKEVNPGRGRPRYFDKDACRLKAHRKAKDSQEAALDYLVKRAVIDKQYAEARRTSRSPTALRRRAMSLLNEQGWSIVDIGVLFGISEQRVRKIVGKELKRNGKNN